MPGLVRSAAKANGRPPPLRQLLEAGQPLPRSAIAATTIAEVEVSSAMIQNPNEEDTVYWDKRWFASSFATQLGKRIIQTTPQPQQDSNGQGSSKKQCLGNSAAAAASSSSSSATTTTTTIAAVVTVPKGIMKIVPQIKPQAPSLKRKAKEHIVQQIMEKSAELQTLKANGPSESGNEAKQTARDKDVDHAQLKELCTKWRGACREVLHALLHEIKSMHCSAERETPTMKALLGFYKVPHDLIGYDPDCDDFVDTESEEDGDEFYYLE